MSYADYLKKLRGPYTRLAKLEFLNPDGSAAFQITSDDRDRKAKALIADGSVTCALNNGRRRQATVVLDNVSGDYEQAVSKLWFGRQIRLSEGLRLDDGTDYLIPQGVFYAENPEEVISPTGHTVTLKLADKWSILDGSLGGVLEGDYLIEAGTNIFDAVQSLLMLNRYTNESESTRSINCIDNVVPVFTNWFNGKTQTLSDGTTASLIETPCDILTSAGGTLADVLLSLADLLPARIGYDACGRLRMDPNADDMDDVSRPILWSFSDTDKMLLNLNYTARNTEVYNDCIVVGATLDDYSTPRARVRNLDARSSTCVNRIGLKTCRIEMPDYQSNDVCLSYAEWKLKRAAVPVKALELQCAPMFHLSENGIITLQRSDKAEQERHIIQSFTRPLSGGAMTISTLSAEDFPEVTEIKET